MTAQVSLISRMQWICKPRTFGRVRQSIEVISRSVFSCPFPLKCADGKPRGQAKLAQHDLLHPSPFAASVRPSTGSRDEMAEMKALIPGTQTGRHALTDKHRRNHSYLRISLTERCNLRCKSRRSLRSRRMLTWRFVRHILHASSRTPTHALRIHPHKLRDRASIETLCFPRRQ
jgi:hypothetical protein